jgi:predicted regulator of Ras-like GTPase activity (Roadblock/LC7/MglB family)
MATITKEELNIFDQISLRIIKEQELIIGPIAWEEAEKVQGFHITDKDGGLVEFEGDPKDVLNRLVAQYSRLFGQVSKEVCKGAVQDLIAELPDADVPDNLQ